MNEMKNRLQPQELWWQHYDRLDMIAKHGDIIFDSDKLLIPVRQYFHLLDIAAFDSITYYEVLNSNYLLKTIFEFLLKRYDFHKDKGFYMDKEAFKKYLRENGCVV